MTIFQTKRGSNQYQKKVHTPVVGPILAFGVGATLLVSFVLPIGPDKTTKFLKGFTFGQFPAVAVAAETQIAGTSGQMKEATVENVVSEIARVFGPHGKQVVKQALDISMCESGWRADAYNFNTNKTGDYNIFQVNSLWTKVFGDLYQHNWIENIRVAHEIYLRNHSFGPWVCAKKLGITK